MTESIAKNMDAKQVNAFHRFHLTGTGPACSFLFELASKLSEGLFQFIQFLA